MTKPHLFVLFATDYKVYHHVILDLNVNIYCFVNHVIKEVDPVSLSKKVISQSPLRVMPSELIICVSAIKHNYNSRTLLLEIMEFQVQSKSISWWRFPSLSSVILNYIVFWGTHKGCYSKQVQFKYIWWWEICFWAVLFSIYLYCISECVFKDIFYIWN